MVFNRMCVTAEGFILPCCLGPKDMVAADLNKVSVKEAWNSDVFRHLRRWHLDNAIPKECYCHNCLYGTNYKTKPLIEIMNRDAGV